MNSITSRVFLIVLANSLVFAELTIDNPRHLDVPEQKARVLLRLACRAVARELHTHEPSKSEFDLRLVLGEDDERFGIDERSGVSTLHLQKWDENRFATAAVRLAVQKSIDRNREQRLILDILQRSEQMVAIPADKLRGAEVPGRNQAGQEGSGCLGGILDASQRDIRCSPLNQGPRR